MEEEETRGQVMNQTPNSICFIIRTKIISGPRPFKSWSGLSLDTAEDVKEAKIFYTNIGVTIMRCLEDHINMPYVQF